MAELTDTNKHLPDAQQPNHCGADHGACCHCRTVISQLGSGTQTNQTAPIKEVLLVFLLPLISAAAVAIWIVRSWPALARHPGYLALVALLIALVALVIARALTYKRINRARTNQTRI